ncbi:MAG: universal stress protein [Desulfobacterales bacterium]|nr:universal stress protein [Desulfobacterales bacterium]
MEKVLLAIDGVMPDKKAFNHAVELCLRIKAELKVLQIVGPEKVSGCLQRMKKTARQAKQYFEGSMMAATFAEAGEHATAEALLAEAMENIRKLLPESEKAGVPYQLTMKSGDPRREIVRYIREHRDVVITVYDLGGGASQSERRKKNAFQAISGALPVPVVMVQGGS